MSRLTQRNECNTHYYYPLCFEKCNGMGRSKECKYCSMDEDICEKLGAYEDAEEQGLLPIFHLGDEFWIEWLGEVLKAKIVMLQQKKDGTWKYRFCDERSHTMDYEEREYGKYFLSTKEESEMRKE